MRTRDNKLYKCYYSIKNRCYCVTSRDYKNYGARGIGMSDEWRNSFKAFETWALANGYQEGLLIDRIDNNGDYSAENCRWVTIEQSNKNKRNVIMIDGMSLSEYCETYGFPYTTILNRLRSGWTLERTFKEPINTYFSSKIKKEV